MQEDLHLPASRVLSKGTLTNTKSLGAELVCLPSHNDSLNMSDFIDYIPLREPSSCSSDQEILRLYETRKYISVFAWWTQSSLT
jgi:hypothetical protein